MQRAEGEPASSADSNEDPRTTAEQQVPISTPASTATSPAQPAAPSSEPRTSVPPLEGMTSDEARAQLVSVGLVADVATVDGPGPYGQVVSSEPVHGDRGASWKHCASHH